jgi:DNA repair protein RadA/Sms
VILPPDTVLFGEVSLSGAIRQVSHAGARLKEAHRLGFTQAIVHPIGDISNGIKVSELNTLDALVARISAMATRLQRKGA